MHTNHPGIIWLASYPKSGNTWVRFLLYSYLYGEISNSNDVASRIPDIHTLLHNRIDMQGVGGTVICKSHYLGGDTHPNRVNTLAFIYIVRHPKDILLSNLNYFRLLYADQLDARQFACSFIKCLGAPEWRQAGFGSWPEHVESWLNDTTCPSRLIVRYEDLHADTAGKLVEMLELIGIRPDPYRVEWAVAQSSFNAMKYLEFREKRSDRESLVFPSVNAKNSPCNFMHRGEITQSLAAIDTELDASFDLAFGQAIADTGLY